MKKHLLKLLLLCCIGILALSIFACVPTTEQYKVDFIVDGQIYKSTTTTGNSRVVLPSDPTKTDYIFKGWYFDEGKWTKEFNAHSFEKDPIDTDVNIYAWFELDKSHTCNKQWKTEIAATCQSEGKRVQRCAYPECAKVYAVEALPVSTTHSANKDTVKAEVKPATCTTKGSYKEMYYCSVCKVKTGEKAFETPIDKNAHKVSNDSINHTNLVRCDEGFELNLSCSLCSFKDKKSLNLTDLNEVITENATCEETGKKYYTYSIYGTEFTSAFETIESKGHYINGVAIKADTIYSEKTHSKIFTQITLIADDSKCEEETSGIFKCEVCSESKYISVYKPHVGTWVKIADATCYEAGEEQLDFCSACEKTELIREIPTIETHVEGKTVLVMDGTKFHLGVACVNKELGCDYVDIRVENVEVTSKTIISKDCKVPDVIRYTHVASTGTYTYDYPIAQGHFIGDDRAESIIDPAGWYDYRYVGSGITLFDNSPITCDTLTNGMYICTSCREHILVSVYRPHSGSWKTTTEATCTSTGVANFYCDLCDYGDDGKVTKVIEKLDHDYGFTLGIAGDNSFTLEGKCSCGREEVINNVSVAVTVTKEPTCKEAGSILYSCYYNGNEYNKVDDIPVTPHSVNNEFIEVGARLEYAKYVKTGLVELVYANLSCTSSASNTANDVNGSYICTECGETVQVKVYRLHDKVANVTYDTNESPCIISGTKKYSCSYYGCSYESSTETFVEENHNYIATLTQESDGTYTVVATCNVVDCGHSETYAGLASVGQKVKTEATCSTMGSVEYTFKYGGKNYVLNAVIDRGNHILCGVDYETLYVDGKLPFDITSFVIVGDAYYFMCEECGQLVRVEVFHPGKK